ncbi:MerR family transcriptional regulator [Photobacterium sp. TY1-4]|uniref:MerR family transcriptional regulator n=1 Tax=Photobacterium sp. TY1-4 TaxID=2899122 RepID=UPI0021BF2A85|nr:MerR family transcriptional regulator [Photobacterium sp. TY1-4]UXI03374.1 MerR family transcriptional regulator [Photobacterium sp. TY1-4]
MYQISELAAKVGLSRTAILYYEKQGLISGHRLENGYRVYSDNDLQRVRLIQRLQAGGLTLQECKVCLEAKVDKQLLRNRLKALDEEIARKQQSRLLLTAMLGEGDLKAWHQSLETVAPDAHLDWLIKQGFSEKEALRLRWLSKDMNEHDLYMADFMKVFETLERWGPGSEEDTRKALSLVPKAPRTILEVGCGKGLATTVLVEQSEAKITVIDNEQSALNQVIQRFKPEVISDRLETICASMTDLPFSNKSFDLIWAEGCAYIMGIEKALAEWKPVLREQGYLVISDMVWRTQTPSSEPIAFWKQAYPDIQCVQTRLKQMEKAGYQVIEHFPQSETARLNYYTPLSERVAELEPSMPSSAALKDIKHEVNVCTQFAEEFGYHMFILMKA